jgi:hypothetical protein
MGIQSRQAAHAGLIQFHGFDRFLIDGNFFEAFFKTLFEIVYIDVLAHGGLPRYIFVIWVCTSLK